MATTGEVSQMLLEGRDEAAAMAYLAHQARALSRAELAVVALYDDNADLVVCAADTRRHRGRRLASGPGSGLGAGSSTTSGGGTWSPAGALVLVLTREGEQPDANLAGAIRTLRRGGPHGPTALLPIAIGDRRGGRPRRRLDAGCRTHRE